MKKLLALSTALALSSFAFVTHAAPVMLDDNSSQLRPSGTVSVSGARDLSDLEDKLAEKARREGAKWYIVNSAGGDDSMYGTATIYK
ncbi:DUF1471 family periplasmic protein McbA [Atlantibacter sp. RC6]|uniref:DUF1471 family periplasmic protein McbA n=1 Tax=Atlantibacter sp. RC6 TaxID=2587036 RepID=UPI001606C7DB|nr:DUF1471 family periplasmic protein McbA [Atlantibacter sp. RC6]MBB3323143.1 MqsR-controlled colanic acid and biofilm protein A [Atlantibacter sp. RC6]